MDNENASMAGTNTAILRQALDTLQLVYVVSPIQAGLDGMTSLSYDGIGEAPGWLTNIFSSEVTPTVRMYSWLFLDPSAIDHARLFEAINLVNYDYFLDSVVDYSSAQDRLRIRDVHRGSNAKLDSKDLSNDLNAHFSRVATWNLVFTKVLSSREPLAELIKTTLSASIAFLEEKRLQGLGAPKTDAERASP